MSYAETAKYSLEFWTEHESLSPAARGIFSKIKRALLIAASDAAGAAAGAATGAALGSVAGGPGAAVGASVGAVVCGAISSARSASTGTFCVVVSVSSIKERL